MENEAVFADLRTREFGRLDATNQAYLDFTGSALYAESQIRAHDALLAGCMFGNPHSAHEPSRASTRVMDAARERVLRFLDADPAIYDVCFTANATGAMKLVGEAYPFDPDAGLVLSADNHNSVHGIREYARRAGARVCYLPLDGELRLTDPDDRLGHPGRGLFAYPAQSNFSGVKHPLELVARAHAQGYDVLLDTAAFLPTNPFSLRDCPADFIAISFYKLFGFPTGVGALVARHEALKRLHRPWFAGGTVEYVSVQHGTHRLRPGHEGFEEGTPNFLGIAALEPGFALLDEVQMPRLSRHVLELTAELLAGLTSLQHAGGTPVACVYGPTSTTCRGGTVAFNVLEPSGRPVPFEDVEIRAREAGVAMRGGCFCDPGAAEYAFRWDPEHAAPCYDALASGFTIAQFRDCLGPEMAVGAVRASVGLPTNSRDIQRALDVVASYRQ